MLKRDRERTIAQQYLDPKSYACYDGREVLYGEDWKARKKEVWDRAGGRCEQWIVDWTKPVGSGQRCNGQMHDAHHVEERRKKRDDRMANLKALCRMHHRLAHPEKEPKWSKRQS